MGSRALFSGCNLRTRLCLELSSSSSDILRCPPTALSHPHRPKLHVCVSFCWTTVGHAPCLVLLALEPIAHEQGYGDKAGELCPHHLRGGEGARGTQLCFQEVSITLARFRAFVSHPPTGQLFLAPESKRGRETELE